mmetsp:Transcript_4561/g.10218  ORF Transcript_4561/g.10218 Transcript_4561/m.10218 type:complete len:89 (+) Transcript_4561:195-461(+)
MCDKFPGTCVCATGYDGRDYSGKQGDCYLSFDGTCRAGFDAGTFVLNTEDEGNLNRGDGTLPQGLSCGSGEFPTRDGVREYLWGKPAL